MLHIVTSLAFLLHGGPVAHIDIDAIDAKLAGTAAARPFHGGSSPCSFMRFQQSLCRDGM
ncbi:hypothetical protein [Sorangium sp. So ce1153]|uniref:hypothetical protein n=1 Tax=Sorangium sp. So ce1153 TaxID=3133333 RepID=UPI003F617C89